MPLGETHLGILSQHKKDTEWSSLSLVQGAPIISDGLIEDTLAAVSKAGHDLSHSARETYVVPCYNAITQHRPHGGYTKRERYS